MYSLIGVEKRWARWDRVGMNAIPASGMAISHPMSSEGGSLDDDTERGEDLSQNVHVRSDTAPAISDPPILPYARN